MAAGGIGARAGAEADVPKQFRTLAGRPILTWSIETLQAAGCEPIVAVVPEQWIERASSLLGDQVMPVAGGQTRQASVMNGLAVIERDRVVVHDGARPFVTTDLVKRALDALVDCDGAVTAIPIDETVKRIEGDRVVHTVDRSQLWRVQTPQVFWTEKLRLVHRRASIDAIEATDDAALIETFGGTVRVVAGSRTNIKITHPEDLAMAEHIAIRLT